MIDDDDDENQNYYGQIVIEDDRHDDEERKDYGTIKVDRIRMIEATYVCLQILKRRLGMPILPRLPRPRTLRCPNMRCRAFNSVHSLPTTVASKYSK